MFSSSSGDLSNLSASFEVTFSARKPSQNIKPKVPSDRFSARN